MVLEHGQSNDSSWEKDGTLDLDTNEFVKGSRKLQIQHIDSTIARDDVTLDSFSHLDIKKILRKTDLRLIPMLTILYLLSFLDRGNIGNAKILGLTEDLNITGPQFNWCLTAFFFPYAAFEVPSNMLLKKFR